MLPPATIKAQTITDLGGHFCLLQGTVPVVGLVLESQKYSGTSQLRFSRHLAFTTCSPAAVHKERSETAKDTFLPSSLEITVLSRIPTQDLPLWRSRPLMAIYNTKLLQTKNFPCSN